MKKYTCFGLPLLILFLAACGAHIRHAADRSPHEAAGQPASDLLGGADRRKQPDAALQKSLVSIKVLATDGDWNTAMANARRLSARGYPSSRLDLAEKRFDGTRVYFADGFEDHAREISAELGGDTVMVKPLTWRSIFHIIVVTDTVP